MNRLAEILPRTAKLFPARPAILPTVHFSGLTYEALSDRVEQLCAELKAAGIQPLDRVGILHEKTPDSLVAILATLAAGGVCLPIDVHAPLDRAAFILTNAGARFLLSTAVRADETRLQSKPIATLKSYAFELFELEPVLAEKPDLPPDLAYILYTSGSTGRPKGVMITHQNALSFIQWAKAYFSVSEHDRLSSIAPFHFDLSIFDLYVSLLSGAALYLTGQEEAKNPRLLAKTLADQQISLLYATPTLLRLLVRFGQLEEYTFEHLRAVLYAGETYPVPEFIKLRSAWAKAKYFNLYGPTETNVVTAYAIPAGPLPESMNDIPIGLPCPYARCKLWDARNESITDIASQAEGELIVSGASLSPGYLGVHKADAFFEVEGVTWYRTGDLVKVDEDLQLIFVGRADEMVKRRGYRIEPAEIERAMRLHPVVNEAKVVSYQRKGEVSLMAFLVLSETAKTPPSTVEWKLHAQATLPLYMVPDRFRIIDAIPMTSSQKVDTQYLKSLVNA